MVVSPLTRLPTAQQLAAAAGPGAGCPDLKALRDLRRRLGPAPLRMLFEMLAGPLGRPRMPGIMFGRYRTVAFDGCRSVKVPDSPRNRAWLGKLKAPGSETGYPVIALMTLCETGTRFIGPERSHHQITCALGRLRDVLRASDVLISA